MMQYEIAITPIHIFTSLNGNLTKAKFDVNFTQNIFYKYAFKSKIEFFWQILHLKSYTVKSDVK